MAISVHLLHIPKTGGMSLFRALQGAGVDVTRGHNPADVDDLNDGALVVTLLRNPVDRAWSAYRYELRMNYFDGTLSEYLDREPDIWYWGVRNVQARYVRPGVLVGVTERLHETLAQVCALAGVGVPQEVEWYGRSPDRDYTLCEYSMLAAAVGVEDMTLYNVFRYRVW